MAFERMAAGQLDKWDKRAEAVMTDEAKSTINTHSIIGAIVYVLPMFGLETFIYAFVIWHMYSRIAKSMGRKFNFSAIVGGFIINLLICLVANVFLDFIAVFGLGLIFCGLLGYFATYQSGKSYMGFWQERPQIQCESCKTNNYG